MSYSEILKYRLDGIIRNLPDQIKAHQKEILIAVVVLLLVRLILNSLKWRKNYPPGPTGLPLVGYLPFLSKDTHLDFTELGKKYGSVFSIKLGALDIVILHSAEAIREAFAKPEFLGRPPDNVLRFASFESAFFVREVHVWREQRRFVVQSMKDLGLGKSKIEYEIQDEIRNFLEVLKEHKGQPMDLKEPLSPSMSNNICALVFGKRFDFTDPIRKLLDKKLMYLAENISQTNYSAFYPWLMSLSFFRMFTTLGSAKKSFDEIADVCDKEIKKHKATLDPKNPRDFIDSYLVEIENRKKDPNTTFSESALKGNAADLFNAGSETVRTSILWCIYIIAAYPEVQKKVQREIMEVIGSERLPEYLDQKEMPYTHAVILEIQRWKTIVPLNVTRYTTADTTVGGYNIPKNTTVIANFYAVHRDPKLWDDPDAFKPERFLNSTGTSIVKSNNLMPFSIGKRACPGETMANMEIFLYFTSILQKFHVAFPEGVKPTFDAKLAIVYMLKTFSIRLIPRSD